MESDIGFQAALEEARKGASEGGVPIGACLVSVRSIQDTTQESFLQCDPIALRDSSCTFHLRF
jgi:tRNA(Arg) A34 adenosine deaminase TadA